MLALARVYARSLLRRGFTWAVVASAALIAMAGASLDLFGFDGSPTRSAGVILGTFEIAAVVLAMGARMSGIASEDSDGFRETIVQTAGKTATEFGATVGAAIGAAIASWLGLTILLAFYMLLSTEVPPTLVLLSGPGLAVEAAVAAAWTALGTRLASRVAGAAAGVAAFVVARLDVPAVLRACLPAPLPATTADLVTTMAVGTLAAVGLTLVATTVPAVGEGAK